MNTIADKADLLDAIAHLTEKIDELQVKRIQDKEEIEEELAQWSQINLALMELIQGQASDAREFIVHQQELAKHLLTLGESAQSLGISSEKLKGSLGNLTQCLEEKQVPQLNQLQLSTTDLITYLQGEQAQRLKILEEGMTALINIMEQIPGTERLKTQSQKKKWSFDLFKSPFDVVVSSLCTVALLFTFGQLGGVGNELSRVEERSVWTIQKLERIESFLGIHSQ